MWLSWYVWGSFSACGFKLLCYLTSRVFRFTCCTLVMIRMICFTRTVPLSGFFWFTCSVTLTSWFFCSDGYHGPKCSVYCPGDPHKCVVSGVQYCKNGRYMYYASLPLCTTFIHCHSNLQFLGITYLCHVESYLFSIGQLFFND